MSESFFVKYIIRPLGVVALFVWVFVGGLSSTNKENKLYTTSINISPAQADLTADSTSVNIDLGFAGSLGFEGGSAGCSSGSCSSSCCSTCA